MNGLAYEKKNANTLPKHRPYDLVEGTQLPFGPFIICHKMNLQCFVNTSMKSLRKWFIQHSKSLVGAMILFVNKNDGFIQICVNYYGLN
jgi:hypothetical protein